MRPATLLALAALLALPVASAASPASLSLSGPASPVQLGAGGATVVPVSVTLAMDHFHCQQDAEFLVQLTVAGSGVDASLGNQTVAFTVPAQPFLIEGYSQTREVNLTVAPQDGVADGFAEVTAAFSSDGGSCFAPGGFTPAFANLTLRTQAPAPAQNFTGNVTAGGNETAAGNETVANETNSTGPGATGNLTRPPTGQTGPGNGQYIGDYEPEEATGESAVPGPGLALALGAVAAACTPAPPKTDIRQWAGGMVFRIGTIPVPPRARETVQYRVVVLDQESRQPIETGEGRIFAMNEDSVKVWDVLTYGPEPGTYHAKVSFITSGNWAIGLEFRRDSTRRLERMDWTQDVRPAR